MPDASGQQAFLRLLIQRLAPFADGVEHMDYPRIEELCWLIREVMFGNSTFAAPLPMPTKFTTVEGGDWWTWGTQHQVPGFHGHIHAIKFSDGSEFDAINGWRHLPLHLVAAA